VPKCMLAVELDDGVRARIAPIRPWLGSIGAMGRRQLTDRLAGVMLAAADPLSGASWWLGDRNVRNE